MPLRNLKLAVLYANLILILIVLIAVFAFFTFSGFHYLYARRKYYAIKALPRKDRLLSIPEKWKDLTLSDMHIRASHNTYLTSSQHISISWIASIKDAIDMGARVVELDVGYSSILNKAVVAHGNSSISTTFPVDLEPAINIIKKHAFEHVSDPFILYIEFYHPRQQEHIDRLYNEVYSIIVSKLKDHLRKLDTSLMNEYGDDLRSIPLHKLQNKVILLMHLRPSTSDLSSIVENHLEWRNLKAGESYPPVSDRFERIIRIWPSHSTAFLSTNADPIPYMEKNFGLVAMNFGMNDKNLYRYLKVFGPYTMIPFWNNNKLNQYLQNS